MATKRTSVCSLSTALLLLAVACDSGRSASTASSVSSPTVLPVQARTDVPTGTEYTHTVDRGLLDLTEVALCELVKGYSGGAGLFRVDQIVGTEERLLDSEGTGVYTYIRLSRIEDWSGTAPEQAVVRVGGNPTNTYVTTSQGEVIGVLLEPPRAENKNYYGLWPLGVFRNVDGGFTNGELFTKDKAPLDKIRAIMQLAARGPECKGDVQPDVHRDTAVPPNNNRIVIGPTIQLGRGEDLPPVAGASSAVPAGSDADGGFENPKSGSTPRKR